MLTKPKNYLLFKSALLLPVLSSGLFQIPAGEQVMLFPFAISFLPYHYLIIGFLLAAVPATFFYIRWMHLKKLSFSIQSIEEDKEKGYLQEIIDTVSDFIYIKDTKSRFVQANKAVASNMGTTPKELIGKTDLDFYPKELAEQFFNDEQDIIKTGRIIDNHVEPSLDPQGNELIVSTTKAPLKNARGKIIGILGIGRNITAEKRAEEEVKKANEKIRLERNQLRTLIDNIPDYIYIKDTECRFLVANKALARTVRVDSPDDLIGKTDLDFYPQELARKFYKDDLNVMKTRQPLINHEEPGIDEHGKKLFIASTKVPLIANKGEIKGIIGIGRDITALYQTRVKLQRKSEDLHEVNVLLEERQEEVQQQAEELKAQADSLQQINSELEKLNATKDKFFSLIAHDLKNPFVAITSLSDLLVKDHQKLTEVEKTELVKLIKVSSENAYGLLENLLHWARTQTDRIKYNPKSFDLHTAVEENIKFHRISSERKHIKIHSSIPNNIMVYADHNMINLVIRNLLSNAIKFTDMFGKIMIYHKEENEEIELFIEDNGVGIDPAHVDKLFTIEDNYTNTGTSGETGTGLGLVICKEFVVKNGGNIKVSSQQGKGSTFSFTVPIAPEQ